MKDFEELSASFEGVISVLKKDQLDQLGISKASLSEQAKQLFPESFDKTKNFDVLPVVFNLAVVNEFNRNGDGITAETAIAAVKNFINKPINIEHKKNKIVGHILNASLSYGENDFKDHNLEDFAQENKPFYITAAGVIYRKIFPKLAEAIINASDPESPDYQSISTSWEVGFKQYLLALTKDSSLISEGTIITDAKEIVETKKCHKAFGGKGIDKTGNNVNRIIVGEVLPLGAGLTYSPAAKVKGISLVEDDDMEEENSKEIELNDICAKFNLQKNSLIGKNIVRIGKFREILNMDEKQFKQFMDKLEQSVASVTTMEESQAKAVSLVMRDTLKEFGEGWKSQVQSAKEESEKVKTDLDTLKASFDSTNKELAELKKVSEAKAAADLFNQRMNFLEENYEFAEAELSLVVNDLKTIEASDDAFDAFKSKLGVLFSHKLKTAIASQKEAIQLQIEEAVAKRIEAKASTTDDNTAKNENTLDDLESESATIPNGSEESSKKESVVEKLRKNFSVEVKF